VNGLVEIDTIHTSEKMDRMEQSVVKEIANLIKFATLKVASLEEKGRGEGMMTSLHHLVLM